MNWLSLLGGAAKFVFSGVIDSIKQNRVLKAREDAAEHNLKLAVVQAKITKAQQDGEWESAAIARSGWKDEAMFIIVMTPLVLCFIPGMSHFVMDGFNALDESLPDWWRYMVIATVGVSYGIKPLTKLKVLRKLK
jgi:hypothetical protein